MIDVVSRRPYPPAYGCGQVSTLSFSFVREKSLSAWHFLLTPTHLCACKITAQWPAIAPVMVKVGPALILKIAERYNNETMWKAKVPSLKGPPLLRSTWTKEGTKSDSTACEDEAPFAGIEISNEWNSEFLTPPTSLTFAVVGLFCVCNA